MCVDPTQNVSAASIVQVLMKKEAWLCRVAVAVVEAEVRTLQLPQQAEPIAHHRRLVPTHFKPRPVHMDRYIFAMLVIVKTNCLKTVNIVNIKCKPDVNVIHWVDNNSINS